MRGSILGAAVLLAWSAGCEAPRTGSTISRGALAPRAAAAGVVHLRSDRMECSGTLVASQWVLTAAHCVEEMSGPPEVLVRAYHAARAARIDADRCEIHPRAYRGVDRCFRRVRAEVREAHDLAMVHLTAIVPSFIARPIAVDLDAPFPERWHGERVWRVGWNRKPAVVGALRRVGGWHRVSLVSRGVVVTRPLGGSDRIRHVFSLPARPFAPRRGDSGGPILHMERDAAMLIGVLSGVADGEPHDWTAGVHASVAAPDNASFIWRVLADQSALQSTGRSVATSSRTHQSPVSRFSSGVVNR